MYKRKHISKRIYFYSVVVSAVFLMSLFLLSAQLVVAVGEGDKVLHLHLEDDIPTLPDSSGYGNHAINRNLGASEGKVGNALYFDGWKDWAEVDDDPSLDVSSKATIAAWIRINTFPTWQEGAGQIIDKHVHDEMGPFGMMIKPNGIVRARFVTTAGVPANVETSITAGTWYHVAATWGYGWATLYVNGVIKDNMQVWGDLKANNYPVYIGRGVERNYYFNGSIDEVQIHKKTLSADAIRAIAYVHALSEDPCETHLEGFWVSCEGAQYVGRDSGWVWVEYDDDAVYAFDEWQKVEFEWIVPIDNYWNIIRLGLTNFIDPATDDADGLLDPGGNEYGVVEKAPEEWVKGTRYYAFFGFYDYPLPEDTLITLEVEFNTLWPVSGCQVKDVPVLESIYWINANRDVYGYEHGSWGGEGESSSMATPEEPEVKDYSDFLTVDLLRLEEMRVLQAKHNLNITGVEMFNAETGETAWVYLTHGESVEQGLKRLEEFVAKDLSGFRVYAIKLDQIPLAVLEDLVVLSIGRIHPNNPEWEGTP